MKEPLAKRGFGGAAKFSERFCAVYLAEVCSQPHCRILEYLTAVPRSDSSWKEGLDEVILTPGTALLKEGANNTNLCHTASHGMDLGSKNTALKL